MIIVRSPLRITLCGGGTDLPCYYRDHEGFLIAATIDKYIYVTVNRPFFPGIYLKYSEIEHVEAIDEVRHRIIREALRLFETGQPQIEITTLAEIPSGTGLGSSGSFTTALLRTLNAHRGTVIHPRELAEQACHIEMELLGESIGKQDQYIAAFGGLTSFTFSKDGTVTAKPFAIAEEIQGAIEDSLLLFFTGYSRSAANVLRDQVTRLKNQDKAMIDSFHSEKENAFRSKVALEKGDLSVYGRLVREHWERKRKRADGISNPKIDRWYDVGMKNGAAGGKLLGAGGGFLMFVPDNKIKLRQAMRDEGLVEVRASQIGAENYFVKALRLQELCIAPGVGVRDRLLQLREVLVLVIANDESYMPRGKGSRRRWRSQNEGDGHNASFRRIRIVPPSRAATAVL